MHYHYYYYPTCYTLCYILLAILYDYIRLAVDPASEAPHEPRVVAEHGEVGRGLFV